jgi:hypothetical protein
LIRFYKNNLLISNIPFYILPSYFRRGNVFAVVAMETVPQERVRVTTSSTRENMRGRGRGRTNASTRANAASKQGAGTTNREKSKKRPTQDSTAARASKSHKRASTTTTTARRDVLDLNAKILPDLNALEVSLTQNAPLVDDM